MGFALSRGKTYAWCEHSPAVHRTSLRFGICYHKVVDAVLDRSRIETRHLKFYDDNATDLYMFDLAQGHAALTAYLAQHTRPLA